MLVVAANPLQSLELGLHGVSTDICYPSITASVTLKTKGRVYDTCVRSAMLYGSDTWASRKTGLARLQRNEGSMLRCVCGVGPEDRVGGAVMCGRLGMSELGDSMSQGRLCWCGHVTGGCDWIAQCHGIGFRTFKEKEM